MTLRLTKELAAELEAVARIENVPVAEAVRQAIAMYLAQRRGDAAFQQRLRASMERHREILDKLASS